MAVDEYTPKSRGLAYFEEQFSRPEISISNVIPSPLNPRELVIMQQTDTGERKLVLSLGNEGTMHITSFPEFSFTRRIQNGGGEAPEIFLVDGEPTLPSDILEAALLGTEFAQRFASSSQVDNEAVRGYGKMHEILVRQQ